MRTRLLPTLALFVIAASLCLGDAPSAKPVPLEDFFRDYTFDDITISPDGSKVAALSKWKEHLNLFILDVRTKKSLQLTRFDTGNVTNVVWSGSDTVLFGVLDKDLRWSGFFSAAADGTRSVALGGSRATRYLSRFGDSADQILVVNNARREYEPDVYRLNVRKNILHRVATNPGDVRGWLADHTGAVRVGYGEIGRKKFLTYRNKETDPWKQIRQWDFIEGDNVPVRFHADNRRVYLLSSEGRNTAALVLYDPEQNKITEVLASDDTYDVGYVILSPKDKRLLGAYIEAEKPRYLWIDTRFKKLQALIDQELPDTVNSVYSITDDERWVVFLASSDRNPGTFFLLDTRELTMERIVSRAPWLETAPLGEMRTIHYTARDGRTIHGYLTLPSGRTPENLPLVVNPHGGPWARDTWGYNPEVQFLASRGYAVLQVNFRGSTGYGEKHLQAGYGQWGLAMQDDITDAVKWCIDQGYADPKRIAIFGASYGGYATMAGLAFTPELYRCGINYVGVADIDLLMMTVPKSWRLVQDQLNVMTGDRKKDRERLEATSPLRNVDKIRAPVFLAYGERDDRIDIKHATRLASALREHGVPVEMMVRSDEGHGYFRWKNKIAFYRKLEEFLAKNMQ